MNNWLVWTCCGELASIGVFSGLLRWIDTTFPRAVGDLAIVGALTLNALLLQGALYWLSKRGRFLERAPARARLRLIRGLYALNSLLILVFPALAVSRLAAADSPRVSDAAVGAGYYLFGLGEFLHYFVFKVNMRPSERRDALRHRRRVPARFWRELRRAQREVEHLP